MFGSTCFLKKSSRIAEFLYVGIAAKPGVNQLGNRTDHESLHTGGWREQETVRAFGEQSHRLLRAGRDVRVAACRLMPRRPERRRHC